MKHGKFQKKKKKSFALPIIAILLCGILAGGLGLLLSRQFGKDNLIVAKNAEEAIEQLAELGEEFGYSNALSELTEIHSTTLDGDKFFRLQQNYQGIPVYGRSVVCVTDKRGQQVALTGNPLDVDEDFSLIPSVSLDTIEEQIYIYASKEFGYGEEVSIAVHAINDQCLCIYIDKENGQSHLAYDVYVNVVAEDGHLAPYRGVVDAQNGTVYQMVSLQTAENRQYEIVNNDGKKNSIDINTAIRNGNKYLELVDEDRRIRVYNIQEEILEYEVYYEGNTIYKNDVTNEAVFRELNQDRVKRKRATTQLFIKGENGFRTELVSPDRIPESTGIEGFDNDALSLLSGLQTTYDFYEDYLQLDGIGWDELWIDGICNDQMPSMGAYNAYCSGIGRWAMELPNVVISFGCENKVSLDTIAHEYTHGIEMCRSGMDYSGESGALMEALSDIFGELVEDYFLQKTERTNADWIHGERYLCNPEGNSENPYPAYYLGRRWERTENNGVKNDYGGVHTNNTVISHAAYLMWDGIDGTENKKISTRELAKLWYRTILMMPSDCSFMECRNLVILAAESMNLTQTQIDCIVEAFELVGLTNEATVDYLVQESATLSVYRSDGIPCDDYTLKISSTWYGSDVHGNMLKKSKIQNITVQSSRPVDVGFKLGGQYTITVSSGENTEMTSTTFSVGTRVDSPNDSIEIFTDADGVFSLFPNRFDEYGSTRSMDSGLDLSSDGTFTLKLKSLDWGDQGDGYPDGTCYISEFNGKFSDVTQVDDHTYKLPIDFIEQSGQGGDEYIEDKIRYIVQEDSRFSQLSECYIYSPGTPFEISDGCWGSLNGKELFYIGPYYGDLEELLSNRYVLWCGENIPVFLSELVTIENAEDTSETNSDGNILASSLGFTKSWDIYQEDNGAMLVTSYAFQDDGTFYYGIGIHLSEYWTLSYGTYEVDGDEIFLNFVEDDGDEKQVSYRIDGREMTFTQTSEQGLYFDHVKGQTFHLEENQENDAMDLKNMVKTFGNWNGEGGYS